MQVKYMEYKHSLSTDEDKKYHAARMRLQHELKAA